MQPNTITIVTDVLNNGTTENHVFEKVREVGSMSLYHGPGHSDAMRNTLVLKTNEPKASGNFPGTRKSSIKWTKDQLVAGVDGANVKQPAILEISTSFPTGTTTAVQLVMRQEAVNLIDQDAIMEPLQNRGVV